jgi:hypothetical protein
MGLAHGEALKAFNQDDSDATVVLARLAVVGREGLDCTAAADFFFWVLAGGRRLVDALTVVLRAGAGFAFLPARRAAGFFPAALMAGFLVALVVVFFAALARDLDLVTPNLPRT